MTSVFPPPQSPPPQSPPPVSPPTRLPTPGEPPPTTTSTVDRRRLGDRLIDHLRQSPAWVIITQLFIGLGWLRAATEKVIDPDWWSGSAIAGFLAEREAQTLGWYQPFADSIVLPAAALVAAVVLAAQLFAGLSLVTGRRLGVGLAVGIFLNLHFMAAGAVTPSAFYLLAQGAIALWLAERTDETRSAGTRAIDRRATVRLGHAAAIALFLAGLNLPFISTLHPEHVIEDPAVMFAFGGTLTAVGCLLAAQRRTCPSLATPL